MIALWSLALAVGFAAADVSHLGYNYKVPHTSYGVPSYQISHNAGDYNTGWSGNGQGGSHSTTSASQGTVGLGQQNSVSNTGYQSLNSANAGNGYQSGGNYHTGGGGYQTGVLGGQQQTQQQQSDLYNGFGSGSGVVSQPSYQVAGNAQNGYQNQYQLSSHYQASAVQKYQENYNHYQQQPAQVFKHFYVHAAPEEPEAPRVRQPISLPSPQKHYKIIFIKTPSQPAPTPQYVPVQQQNEEKTIVYVLLKKPEEQQEVAVPKFEQKPPSKPEVFFIKYKNKEDSQSVINNIVNDYSKGDASFAVSGGSTEGSGHYSQEGTGQYVHDVGTGQYAQAAGSGQYAQSSGSNHIAQSAGSGHYTTSGFGGQSQLMDTGSQGTSAFGVQALNVAADTGLESSLSSRGAASSVSTVNYDNANTISTSQGIPHETYGPPKFRV